MNGWLDVPVYVGEFPAGDSPRGKLRKAHHKIMNTQHSTLNIQPTMINYPGQYGFLPEY